MSKANGLDSWKNITKPTDVETRHRRNEDTRHKERTLEEKVKSAFENHRKGNLQAKREGAVIQEKGAPKGSLSAEGSTQGKIDLKPKNTQPAGTETVAKQPIKPRSEGAVSENVYKNVPASPPLVKNPLQARAESLFVTTIKEPTLTDLLLKRSSIPPAPPTADEKEKQIKKEAKLDALTVLKELPDPKVKGPIASDAGAKLGDTSKKQESAEKKKDGKKTESRDGAKGAHAARGADSSEGEQRLEAASSGVTSGGEETAGIEIFNPETKLDENLGIVLEKRSLLEKVYKNFSDPRRAEVAEEVLRNALALNEDPELNRILSRGLAARRNIYGVTGG